MRHSLIVAVDAHRMCGLERLSNELAEEAFTAGILHDIGKLVLLTADPEAFEQACFGAFAEEVSLHESEKRIFGVSHAEIGAYLAFKWGLPQPLVEIIAFHQDHQWNQSRSFSTLSAVDLANQFGKEGASVENPCLVEYANQIGCQDKLEAWLNLCQGCPSEGMEPAGS